jgi:hypothetical protein
VSQGEIEVITKIRNSKDPDLALQIATEIVISYLMQKESYRSQSACHQPEASATTE